jgi:hypothetical protein
LKPRLYRKHAHVWAAAPGDEDPVAVGGALDVVPEVVAKPVRPDADDFGW